MRDDTQMAMEELEHKVMKRMKLLLIRDDNEK